MKRIFLIVGLLALATLSGCAALDGIITVEPYAWSSGPSPYYRGGYGYGMSGESLAYQRGFQAELQRQQYERENLAYESGRQQAASGGQRHRSGRWHGVYYSW